MHNQRLHLRTSYKVLLSIDPLCFTCWAPTLKWFRLASSRIWMNSTQSVVILRESTQCCWSLTLNNDCTGPCFISWNQIKLKLLVFGAVIATINDQGCQHVTGRLESIRMCLNKSAGWPTIVLSHFPIKTVEWFKSQLLLNLPTYRKGEN